MINSIRRLLNYISDPINYSRLTGTQEPNFSHCMMSAMFVRQILLSIFLLGIILVNEAIAVSVYGEVTFVGTVGQFRDEQGRYHAQFRFRVSTSTCDRFDGNGRQGDGSEARWIKVRSGAVIEPYQHNMANFMNAYNTVLTGFVSHSGIQVDQVPSCNADETQILRLWRSAIAIMPEALQPVSSAPVPGTASPTDGISCPVATPLCCAGKVLSNGRCQSLSECKSALTIETCSGTGSSINSDDTGSIPR